MVTLKSYTRRFRYWLQGSETPPSLSVGRKTLSFNLSWGSECTGRERWSVGDLTYFTIFICDDKGRWDFFSPCDLRGTRRGTERPDDRPLVRGGPSVRDRPVRRQMTIISWRHKSVESYRDIGGGPDPWILGVTNKSTVKTRSGEGKRLSSRSKLLRVSPIPHPISQVLMIKGLIDRVDRDLLPSCLLTDMLCPQNQPYLKGDENFFLN